MRYKHVGTKVVIDSYGDLIIDPSIVESLFKTHSNRKLRPHLVNSYLNNIDRCIEVRSRLQMDAVSRLSLTSQSSQAMMMQSYSA